MRLLPFSGQAVRLIAGTSTALGLVAVQLSIPVLLGLIVDRGLLAADSSFLMISAVALACCGVLTFGFQVAHQVAFSAAGEAALRCQQANLLKQILRIPMSAIRSHTSAELQTFLREDASAVARLSGEFLGQALVALLQLGGLLGLLVLRFKGLALVALVLCPLYLLVPAMLARLLRRDNRKLMESVSDVNGLLEEVALGVRDLKLLVGEQAALEKFNALALKRQSRRVRLRGREGLNWVNYALSFIVGGVVYWLGGERVLSGDLTVGSLVTLVALLGYLDGPIQSLAMLWGTLQSSRAASERLTAVTSQPVEEPLPLKTPYSSGARAAMKVVVEDVSLTYAPGRRPALDGVGFSLGPGFVQAVVGESGSGKSTLAAILVRLLEPSRGTVLLNGTDVRRVPVESLRRSIALVPQEPFLFSGSVRDNLVIGCPSAPFERIEASARTAQAEVFIRALPQGYDTEIGDRGLTLSGGERQRLAIARALVTEPEVLVLDESTSALDPSSEVALLRALRSEYPTMGIVWITHRLSALGLADSILLLVDGKLAAQGSHQHLLASSSKYLALQGSLAAEDGV